MILSFALARWETGPRDLVTLIWLVGWLVCAVIISAAYAYSAGRVGATRGRALLGATVRGSISGLVWPALLLWWLVTGVRSDE
jgi:hypothetical protein